MLKRNKFPSSCENLYALIDVISQKNCDHSEEFVEFVGLAREITSAAPSLALQVANVSSLVLLGRYKEALLECRYLIASETKIMSMVSMQAVH